MAINVSDFFLFFLKLYSIQFEATFWGQELQAVFYFLLFENSTKIELNPFLNFVKKFPYNNMV